ncbi:hypothetical protein MTMBA_06370 [Moorella thermoacetica]
MEVSLPILFSFSHLTTLYKKSTRLKEGGNHNGTKEIFRTKIKDLPKSSQFTSNLFEQTCSDVGIEHELIPYKKPNNNAYIRPFHSILEEKCLSLHEFYSFRKATRYYISLR